MSQHVHTDRCAHGMCAHTHSEHTHDAHTPSVGKPAGARRTGPRHADESPPEGDESPPHDHACGCGEAHDHDHDHDHGCGCGCGEAHDHDYSHDHGCGCGEAHDHDHDHACGEAHDHGHGHDHDHSHGHACGCGEAHDHGHDHDHSHGHDHDHSHGHDHAHDHDHDHSHGHACGCGETHSHDHADHPKRTAVFLLISLASLVLSFLDLAERTGLALFHVLDPAWIAILLCSFPLFKSACTDLFGRRKISSSLLISVAITASICLELLRFAGVSTGADHGESYVFAAGEIAFLMALGELLEALTVRRSRAGIEKLVRLSPQTALRLEDGRQAETPVEALAIGDTVLVRPNDVIPVDGTIISGVTSVDQSAMTGESLAVDKGPGDTVFAGTNNQSGALTVRVDKLAKDRAVSRLADLTLEAEGRRAPISRVADRWASLIVPAAGVLSLLVGLIACFLLRVPVGMAIVRGVTILVVFCPCALALATPTAVAAGLGNAARRGILVKSGQALEAAAKIDTVALDKTGTLTTGQVSVAGVRAFGMAEADMLALAGAAETYAEHPVARAIYEYAAARTALPEPDQTTSLMGVGVQSTVGGRQVLVGKYAHAAQLGLTTAQTDEAADAWLSEGKMVNAVCVDGALCGLIAAADTMREDAAQAVAALHAIGLDTVMLTGDNAQTAAFIAAQAGVRGMRDSLMPDEKLDAIRRMEARGRRVCMIGDGVNDAPALAAANCSVAMGALGSDIAIDAADVALMSSELLRLPGFFTLSRRIMRTIKVNIALSMGISVAAIVLSTFGLLTPVSGAFVHNGASIAVVLNSTLLLACRDRFTAGR